VIPGWKGLDLFTYRDGPVVFLVDSKTGLTVSLAASVLAVRAAAVSIFGGRSAADLRALWDSEFEKLNMEPKPRVKLKNL
jgi:hypothetical protein